MYRMALAQFRSALLSLVVLTVLLGLLYPALVTGLAQLLFPARAQGSLILHEGKPVGSELIGQPFSDPKYFWSRPSVTSPQAYNAAASSGSNLGPTHSALCDAVSERVKALREVDSGNTAPIPVDLVTASGSGLDPHISPAAALYQTQRVARVRGLAVEEVRRLVAETTENRQWDCLGEARVNVLRLNLALDSLIPTNPKP